MPDFPAHASPAFTPAASPRPRPHQLRDRGVSDLRLARDDDQPSSHTTVPPPLVSPSITPPHTPDLEASAHRHDRDPRRIPRGIPVDSPQRDPTDTTTSSSEHGSSFLEELPTVTCEVRARIPTTTGTEMWLHLYHNNADDKEHLAIVFGPHIRSRSLDAPRPGETERDRMIRGAYVGTLYPGRTSSRVEQIRREAGVRSTAASTANGVGGGGGVQESGNEEGEVSSGWPAELDPPLVRIHSECYTGETVWSARCDCGEQLDEAARLMSLPVPTPGSTPASESGTKPLLERPTASAGGVIIYLRQEGRGIGLLSKLKAYNLQDLGHDTMEANLLLRHPGDARSYGLATAMLLDLGLGGERGIRLLTNNPDKIRAVEGPHREVRVVERVPMIPLYKQTGGEKGFTSPEVERYLETKIEKFKHMLSK